MTSIKKKILVVCEGGTDFVFLEGIINYIGNSSGRSFDIQMLSPQIDATTGHAERQGWTKVKSWCILHGKKSPDELLALDKETRAVVSRRNWEGLLIMSGADLLLVHLDTDIAGEIDNNFDHTKEHRRDCCERNLNLWLGILSIEPNCKYVLPTYAIETWLLATYDSSSAAMIFSATPEDYELIDDFEDKLIAIGYASKLKASRRRLVKKASRYKNNDMYLPRLLTHITNVQLRCKELLYFMSLIQSI
ncbi:MAG: hypothetical protein WC405_09310 [Syntrophales bacterium]